ncbi:GAF domain-containing SpoIIE family protein phosphatase [Nonomuraea terrae]|uniref:GAF domain-containing SpoIIE family protein phosphatase n=1 Tax=Nonomuraea terrae TaxID=2530383 RepID=UPI001404BDD4|nr:GAF domain-containing SpoIIE family protein phosphatase [Nonomuraea terrae]
MNPGFLIKDPRSRAGLRLSGATASQERLAFLNEASTRIGSTLDLAQTCREVLDVAVPRCADAGGIMVQERLITEGEFPARPNDGTALVRRVATAVAVENPFDWDRAFPVGEVAVYPPFLPQGQAMATARTVLVPRLDQGVGDDNAKAFGRDVIAELLPGCSFLVAPLLARGNVLGFFVLVREASSEAFQDADVALVEELAARTAICIDNARLYARERRTALALQSSLLPARMGQLRTATQTLASLDLDPAELLYRLDRVAGRLDLDQIATCLYARYDVAAGTVQIASAGHLPPVLVRPDGVAETLPVVPGPPLGIGSEQYELCEFPLPAGGLLALYTDGLVEGREWNIDEGLAKLRALLTGPPHGIERICDMVIRTQCPHSDRDDIALLLAKAV